MAPPPPPHSGDAGEEEADWIEAVVEQLRTAKRTASRIKKAKDAAAAKAAAAKSFGEAEEEEEGEGAEEQGDMEKVPEWVTQQLPDLLRLLEACRFLSNVSGVNKSFFGVGSCRLCVRLQCRRSPSRLYPCFVCCYAADATERSRAQESLPNAHGSHQASFFLRGVEKPDREGTSLASSWESLSREFDAVVYNVAIPLPPPHAHT